MNGEGLLRAAGLCVCRRWVVVCRSRRRVLAKRGRERGREGVEFAVSEREEVGGAASRVRLGRGYT